jgi:type I restriction enzyme S subunit
MEVKPGYKQTEVGVIPEDWDVKRLGQVASFNMGGTPERTEINSSHATVPWIKGSDLEREYIYNASNFITEKGMNNSRATYYDAGTVLIGRAGQGKTRGKTAILRKRCTTNETMIGILIDNKKIVCEYLHFNLKLRYRKLRDIGGDQSRGGITQGDLNRLLIPMPVIQEQHAIAEALSDVDGLLGGLDRLIVKKRDLKQAAMQLLLTGQTRLPGFKGEWQEVTLGRLGQFLKGRGVTKDQTQSGNIACVRYGELYTHHSDVIRDFNSWISPEVASTAVRLRKGDILFAGSGETKEEIGKCAAFISDSEAYAGGDIVILRPDETDAVFLGYFLNAASINRQKASRGQGDAVVHISSTALAAICCRIPELPEQTAIAEVLKDMDAELASLEQRREKTRNLKQAMMQELLTGKTRLISPKESNA